MGDAPIQTASLFSTETTLMAVRSRSPKLFVERSGIRPTYRLPQPTHDAGQNPAHALPLESPLPIPELIRVTLGNPPPDRGETTEWPNGTTGS